MVWACEQLYEIINYRYNEKKQTIITSNYTLDEIGERMNHPKDAVQEEVSGSRVIRQIRQCAKKVYLKGNDRSRLYRFE